MAAVSTSSRPKLDIPSAAEVKKKVDDFNAQYMREKKEFVERAYKEKSSRLKMAYDEVYAKLAAMVKTKLDRLIPWDDEKFSSSDESKDDDDEYDGDEYDGDYDDDYAYACGYGHDSEEVSSPTRTEAEKNGIAVLNLDEMFGIRFPKAPGEFVEKSGVVTRSWSFTAREVMFGMTYYSGRFCDADRKIAFAVAIKYGLDSMSPIDWIRDDLESHGYKTSLIYNDVSARFPSKLEIKLC